MARFNLDNYEMVEDRLKRFWKDCPNGAVRTEVVWVSEDGTMVAFSSSLYRDKDDAEPTATGTAMDWKGKTRGAEQTNWWETSETSAIGRAIANSPWQNPNAKRPSRQEMSIAEGRQGGVATPKPKSKITITKTPSNSSIKLKRLHTLLGQVKALNPRMTKEAFYETWGIESSKELSSKHLTEAIEQLEEFVEAYNNQAKDDGKDTVISEPIFDPEDLPTDSPVEGATTSGEGMDRVVSHLQGEGIEGEVIAPPHGYNEDVFPEVDTNPRGSQDGASGKQIATIEKYIRTSRNYSVGHFDWFIRQMYDCSYDEVSKAQASAIMDAFFGKKK